MLLRIARSCVRPPRLAAIVAAGVALGLGVPAAAGTLYHWRTEDGTFAFTDDLRRVPARYRDQVERQASRSLDGYAQFTPQDGAASSEYARQLQKRVEHLRAFNAGEVEDGAPRTAAAAEAASGSAAATQRVEVRVSSEGDPVVRVPAAGLSEPVVIEKVVMIPEDSNATRTNTVVRQGDRVIAIVKPRNRNTSVFYPTEKEFEAGR